MNLEPFNERYKNYVCVFNYKVKYIVTVNCRDKRDDGKYILTVLNKEVENIITVLNEEFKNGNGVVVEIVIELDRNVMTVLKEEIGQNVKYLSCDFCTILCNKRLNFLARQEFYQTIGKLFEIIINHGDELIPCLNAHKDLNRCSEIVRVFS